MVLVLRDAAGLTVRRNLPVFGDVDNEGHAELELRDVRVPAENLVAGEGDGFMIGQARLVPGRIHHGMRTIGAAERALELLCRRAGERETFGAPWPRANVQDRVAEARIEIEMVRLLCPKTAWLIDTVGNATPARGRGDQGRPAADRAARDRPRDPGHGGAGVSDDTPPARMCAHVRTLRLADGPDEVHKMTIARHELRHHAPAAR